MVNDTPSNDSQLQELWQNYKANITNIVYKNQLITIYLPRVRSIAKGILRGYNGILELEDLVSAGVFGLVDAMESYDLTRGIAFEAYCKKRVRGSMISQMRKMDFVSRNTRYNETLVEQVEESLYCDGTFFPSDEQRLTRLGQILYLRYCKSENQRIKSRLNKARQENGIPLDKQDLSDDEVKLVSNSIASLYGQEILSTVSNHPELFRHKALTNPFYDNDKPIDFIDEESDLKDPAQKSKRKRVNQDYREPEPWQRLELLDELRLFTNGFNQNERLVIILYYYEEMTTYEIAEELDLTEGRISQIKNQVIQRLQSRPYILRNFQERKFNSTAMTRTYNSSLRRKRSQQEKKAA